MTHIPPPNDELAELAAVLGDDNVRTLVQTYLRDFPVLMRDLAAGDRKNQHRLAHSMKSNSRLMGAHRLSRRMAELEARLATEEGADVAADDLAAIRDDFADVAGVLKAFASG